MPNNVTFDARHMAVGLDLNASRNAKPGTIGDGFSARYIKDTGISTGPGYFRINTLGTGLKVDDLFGASNELLKSLWAKSGTKIYNNAHNQDLAYNIGLSLTASERQAFLEVRNGDLLTFNQTDAPSRIAVARLTTAVTVLANDTMIVGATNIDKFTTSGTVYSKGVSYTYSGKSATALTGLGGGPLPSGGLAVNDLITQTSQPSSMSVAKGTCAMILEGSTLIAGVKNNENVVYSSAPATLDNPEFAYDFSANGASGKVMQNPVVAMIKGTTLAYIFGTRFVQSTIGFDIETNVFHTNPVTDDAGAYNSRCVINFGGRAAFLGNKRLMPINLQLNQSGLTIGRPDEDFDTPIRPWLDQFDPIADQLDTALLEYDSVRRLLSITGSINGTLETRLFDVTSGVKAFTPKDVRPMRCHIFFDGNSYFGNNSVDEVYQNHSTLTNNGFPILHSWRTTWLESFARTGKQGKQEVLLDYLEFDGYMARATEFTVNIYTNGNLDIPAYTIDLDDTLITSDVGIAIGTRNVGTNVIGGGGFIPPLAYRMKCNIDLNGLSGESFIIEWVCSTLGGFLQTESYIMEGLGMKFTERDRV